MRQVDQATRRLEEALAEGVATAMACVAIVDGRKKHWSYHGRIEVDGLDEPVGPDTLFDLASLTKVMATTTMISSIHGTGGLDLDAPVHRLLPELSEDGRRVLTVRDLLAHRSGLPAHAEWWRAASVDPRSTHLFRLPERQPTGDGRRLPVASAREATREAVLSTPLERKPRTKAVYSDAGFILLGILLERLTRRPLHTLFGVEIARPLGLASTRFVDEAAPLARAIEVAPTRRAPSRGGGLLVGQVDDDNAYALGGVAGHAGLFGTAEDVASFGQATLEAWEGQRRGPLQPECARVFLRRDPTPGSTRALGWDTPSSRGSAAGKIMSKNQAVGHLGYTGCSLWIDRSRRMVIALLTNRIHCSADPAPIRRLRSEVHDLLA
ncbi:MAG: serine hydrolase [Deltaproteobacteria bacterium]|nr:serine hydrolase [Deltaproteobacteria bacterium]